MVGRLVVLGLLLLGAHSEVTMAGETNTPADTGASAAAAAVLMKADAAFDRDVAERGLDAWVSAFDEAGIMFRAGTIVRDPRPSSGYPFRTPRDPRG